MCFLMFSVLAIISLGWATYPVGHLTCYNISQTSINEQKHSQKNVSFCQTTHNPPVSVLPPMMRAVAAGRNHSKFFFWTPALGAQQTALWHVLEESNQVRFHESGVLSESISGAATQVWRRNGSRLLGSQKAGSRQSAAGCVAREWAGSLPWGEGGIIVGKWRGHIHTSGVDVGRGDVQLTATDH